MPFISFSCLISVARTSNTMLNKSGESGYSCLVPDLKKNAFSFSPLSMMLALCLSYMAFNMLWYDFLHFLYDHMCLSVIVFMWCITQIDLWMLSQPCIQGINPT